MHALLGGAPLGGAAAPPLAAAARRRRAPACRRAASSAPLTRAAQGDVLLEVRDLHAKVAGTDKQILNGLSLTIREGEVHAIMGKNGSGKSTLSKVLVGHPAYEVTSGTVQFKGQDLLALEPEARAHQGLFLSFQSPVEIPGVRRVPRRRCARVCAACMRRRVECARARVARCACRGVALRARQP
jgi:Fe-S cluster assembly ATP-binding protein